MRVPRCGLRRALRGHASGELFQPVWRLTRRTNVQRSSAGCQRSRRRHATHRAGGSTAIYSVCWADVLTLIKHDVWRRRSGEQRCLAVLTLLSLDAFLLFSPPAMLTLCPCLYHG